jgi:hypothetical protein
MVIFLRLIWSSFIRERKIHMQKIHLEVGYNFSTDLGDRCVYGVVLLRLRVRIPPGAWMALVSTVCWQRSMRRADPSPRGALPSFVCVTHCDQVQPPPSIPAVTRQKEGRTKKEEKHSCSIQYCDPGPLFWAEHTPHWLTKRDAFCKHNTAEIWALGIPWLHGDQSTCWTRQVYYRVTQKKIRTSLVKFILAEIYK